MSRDGLRAPQERGAPGGQAWRRLLAALALVIAGTVAAVLVADSIARSRSGFNPLFVSGVLLLSAVLVTVVLFVLGRNLVKLYLERSRGVAGSSYRMKVISLVAGLTLLPSLLLFFVANGILGAALEEWFQPEVESVLGDGRKLLDRYEAEMASRAVHWAEAVGREVAERDLLAPRARRSAAALLERKREDYGLAGLRLYDARGRLVGESYEPARRALRELELPERALDPLLAGETGTLRHAPEKTGELLLFLGVPAGAGKPGPRGAVVALLGLGASPSAALADLNRHWQAYQQAKVNRDSIRQGFVLVLAFFTLLLLFSAIWVGSALAKAITVPIQRLADATRAVAEGRFDVRVEVEAQDELGLLVRSFNRMLEELHARRLDVDRSTRELQHSNVELEGRRKYIETILESIPTGVVTLDQEGRVMNLNRAAMRMFGFRERPPERVHYRDLFAAKEFLELRTLISRIIGIRDIKLMDKPLRFPRRSVELAVSFTALRSAQEDDIGLVLVLEDLSNLIKAQKVAAWREVAQTIAHEIKNPLTPIQLGAQRILKKWRESDPDVGRVIEESTQRITQEVDELMTMVNDFSRFARMPPVQLVPTQLDKVIHNVLVLYEGVHPGLVIERHVAADLPTLPLDPEQMKRVLINLVDNAVHCQDGEGKVIISGSHDPRSQSVRVEVADEGPGIPPEDRDKLFVPYFSTRRGGTGLGLAIVHRIVSDHNGKVWVEENGPRGSRFVIELPA